MPSTGWLLPADCLMAARVSAVAHLLAKRTGTAYPELLPQRILAQRILTSLSLTAPAFWSPRPGCPRGGTRACSAGVLPNRGR